MDHLLHATALNGNYNVRFPSCMLTIELKRWSALGRRLVTFRSFLLRAETSLSAGNKTGELSARAREETCC